MPAALRRINLLLDRIPQAPVALLLRLFPAVIFWQSGRTKVEGLSIKPST